MTRGSARDHPDEGLSANEGNALNEIEDGKQQVLFCVGAHGQQIVLAKVAVDECEQIALGVLVAELLDDLVGQLSR